MSRLVVGIDLSDGAERAVAHGVGLARRLGWDATLVLVDAVPEHVENLPASMQPTAERYAAELTARLEGHRARLGDLRQHWVGHGVELSTLVVDGYPDERLPAVAAELGAELIVVGSHGRTGLRRFLVGSVAERVARRAGTSVLVTRGDAPDGGYHRIVVGTDRSPLADRAVQHALTFAARGAQVHLVQCWGAPVIGELDGFTGSRARAEAEDVLRRDLRFAADELHRGLGRPDLELTCELLDAPPARGLTDTAADRHADLIVVGSHGRRGLRRLVLGSVAEATIRHAPCSVLVARGGDVQV